MYPPGNTYKAQGSRAQLNQPKPKQGNIHHTSVSAGKCVDSAVHDMTPRRSAGARGAQPSFGPEVTRLSSGSDPRDMISSLLFVDNWNKGARRKLVGYRWQKRESEHHVCEFPSG